MTKFLQVILGCREAFFTDMQMVKMRKYISNTDEGVKMTMGLIIAKTAGQKHAEPIVQSRNPILQALTMLCMLLRFTQAIFATSMTMS